MKFKTAIALLLSASILTATAGAIDLFVDGHKLEPDMPPVIVDSRTLVPMRTIFEALDSNVVWNVNTRTATATKGDTTVSITIDDNTAYINGVAKTLDVPAKLINGRTMVPARFVSEALDANVQWDGATQTVYITTTDESATSTPSTSTPAPSTSTPAPSQTVQQQPDTGYHATVYVTPTGKRYHYSASCAGKNATASTLEKAKSRGLTPCQKCAS